MANITPSMDDSKSTTDIDHRQSRVTAYTSIRQDVAGLVPQKALRILDVGCSNGALGGYLKELASARHVVGIELDPEFAREAANVLDAVIQSDLESLDLSSVLSAYAPFDCIICGDVLEHLREPWRQLASLGQLLSSGGELIVGLPNIRHHSALWEIGFRGRFPRRSRGLFDSTHLRWFTFADGIDLLRTVGLEANASSFNIRIGDKGGGFLNRLAAKGLDPIARWWLIREFFVYQYVIRAGRRAHLH